MYPRLKPMAKDPTMRRPRVQMTVRWLMCVVAIVAVTLAAVAKLAKSIMEARGIFIHDIYISIGGYTVWL